MAELNFKQITDKLGEEFKSEGRKIIFWYDDNAEFDGEIEAIELENAKLLRLEKDNQLYIKYFLETEGRSDNFLLYAPFPKPDKQENHLLDVLHYSKEFFVDRASLICADLGIADELKPVIGEYVKFFAAQERTARFYSLDIDKNSRVGIEMGLISAVCKLKVSSFEEGLRVILSESLEDNKYLAELEKYGLTNAFWQHTDITFSFSDSKPTLEKLMMCLFLTYTADVTKCDIPIGLKPFITQKTGSVKAFLDNMMNHTIYGARFDELSSIIYKAINGDNVFANFPVEALTECSLFKEIDDILIAWITARLENEDTSAELDGTGIPEICLKRRKMHFGGAFRSEYFVLENAYYIIKNAKYAPLSDTEYIIKEYTEKWYKIDMRYRYFNLYYDKTSDNGRFEKLRVLIENIYTNDYLDKITVDWASALAETSGKTNLNLQQNFYNDFVVGSKGRVCVIISDAMRYEVGVTLFEQLEADEKCSAKISPMQTVLPSKTQTGMAALLPHKAYTMNNEYKAEVDGKLCDETESRNAHIQTIEPTSKCVQFDSLTKKSQAELREVFAETKFVYVYHNQIDSRGDNAKTEDEVFVACEEAVTEIKALIKRLTTSANTSYFIVTADHGFIYKRDKLYESDKIDGVSGKSSRIGKRYAISDSPIEIEGIRSFPLNTMYSDKEGYVSSPVGTDIIKAPGSGLNFVHGGCSLHEMIVPVIEIKTEKSFTETKKAEFALVTPLKKLTNLNVILEFVQSEAVNDVVKEATYRIFFASEDGETISNENFIIADKTDTETIHRLFKLRFSLKNKTYSKEEKAASASMVFVGNINQSVDVLLKTSSLFDPFPPEMGTDTAFLDRMHCYNPGWEIPKFRPEHFTDDYGFISDYFAEFIRELRKEQLGDKLDTYFRLGKNLNQRDTIAVRRMIDGYLKLLYPDGNFSKDELEEVVKISLEMRRRVKEQLKKLGGMEFYDVNFSYIDNESFEEHYVSVPEQGGGKLIPEGMCNPGQVYTVSQGKSGMIGVFRLESQMLPGNGKLTRTGIGSERESKEASDTAFNFLKANGSHISGTISTTQKDYIINYQDLQGIGMTPKLALPTLIALCSVALAKPVQSSLVVLGEISISGTIIKIDEIANVLQVCLDSGAKKVLIPSTSFADFSTVPPDLMSAFQIIPYSTAEDAVFKALGVE